MTRNPWFYGSAGRLSQVMETSRVIYSQRSSAIVGTEVARFESEVARYLGSPRVLAVSSATSGLELVLADLKLEAGDEVVVPAFGWMSVPGAVVNAGATLRLSDIDLLLHSSVKAVEDRLTSRTRAVVVVHMRGVPNPDTEAIISMCRSRGIAVIEDCAQAWGVRIGDSSIGTLGDYAVFSTQHFKLLVTGEGGVVVAGNQDAARRLYWLSGRTDSDDRYPSWARNMRMPEINAALGRVQLTRLEHTLERLKHVSARMVRVLRTDPQVEVIDSVANGGNGVAVPIVCSSEDHAVEYESVLRSFGIEAGRPGAVGDLHNASSWPVHETEAEGLVGLERLHRYVDVPVPDMSARRAATLTRQLRSAVEAMLRW